MTCIIWLESWRIDIMSVARLSQTGHAGFCKSLNLKGKFLKVIMVNEPNLRQIMSKP